MNVLAQGKDEHSSDSTELMHICIYGHIECDPSEAIYSLADHGIPNRGDPACLTATVHQILSWSEALTS